MNAKTKSSRGEEGKRLPPRTLGQTFPPPETAANSQLEHERKMIS
jgi:hypothetical protein